MNIQIHTSWRRYRKVATFVVFGMCVGALFVWRVLDVIAMQAVPEQNVLLVSETDLTETTLLEASVPTRLRIPKIDVDTTFEGALGLDLRNEVVVPENYEEVGWYKYGPTPGERGPSVILGHVDSYEGPAVFHQLWRLKEGDQVVVDREDGSTVLFEITKREQTSQEAFPTEEVYGDTEYAGLRLITCTGFFNKGEQRYSHNLIVYAELVGVVEGS